MRAETEILKKRIEIKELKDRIGSLKKISNTQLKKEYLGIFRIMDIAVVFIILFNFGALVTTNALVVRDVPEEELVFYEGNKIASELHGFTPVPEEKKSEANLLLLDLVKRTVIWAVLLSIYIFWRNKVYDRKSMALMFVIVMFYFFILGEDFFNNLGFWFGINY